MAAVSLPSAALQPLNRLDQLELLELSTGYQVSDELLRLCSSPHSVSSLIATNPVLSPADAWTRLYGNRKKPSAEAAIAAAGHPAYGHPAAAGTEPISDLAAVELLAEKSNTRLTESSANAKVTLCGKWGPAQPSELFLSIFQDSLRSLDQNLKNAMVSPSLLAGCGTVPLTVISTIPDICRHMANLIVRAEKDVFLATNYWKHGVATTYITNALRQLSQRMGKMGRKAVVKVLYDRGSLEQIIKPRVFVPAKDYTVGDVRLPAPEDVPHLDLEVLNYHQAALGTFHAKFMIVDRKIGLVQSNNIQDNDNVEMMVQLEGPIVDSLYDMALLSWHDRINPPLPSANAPASEGGLTGFKGTSSNPVPGNVKHSAPQPLPHIAEIDETATARPIGPRPVSADHSLDMSRLDLTDQQRAKSASPLPELTTEHPHYDTDIAGEVARVQASVSQASPQLGESHLQAVTRHLNHTVNKDFQADAPDSEPGQELTPYLLHPAEPACAMALVNRPTYGMVMNKSLSVPQNDAWLSALRNASKSVFIQTPNLNAKPLLPAIIAACERGIDVYCYVCLGYNDSGELLPNQGGHNEMIAHNLVSALSNEARPRLHYFWYVGKDQSRPIPQSKKRRSCHIKLMIVDECVGIVGSGNQDTQSWFHSQEFNVLIDSASVCGVWIDGLRRNQNTYQYGALDPDGIWRDSDGKEADGALGIDAGRFAWAKGILGAIGRVRGTGGFG